MVNALDAASQGAVRNRSRQVRRNFVWITPKHRDTGVLQGFGFWDDVETVAVTVKDGETGALVERTFVGDGAIQSIDPIPLRIGIEVRTIQVVLSQIHLAVQSMAREYDPRFAEVQIYRGYFDPDTMLLLAPPRARFVGQVNGAPIDTPAVGGQGALTLRIVSHTRELTRTNAAKKSDESQRRRQDDRFRRYSGVAGQWPFWWGTEKSNGEGAGGSSGGQGRG